MKTSELITKLEAIIKEHGDVKVLLTENGFGGRAVYTADLSSDIETIAGYDIDEQYFEGSLSSEEVKILFPEWDGDEETLNDLKEFKAISIKSDILLYTT